MASAIIIDLPGYPFRNLASASTIAALRAVDVTTVADGANILVNSGSTLGDGYGGTFFWSASSLANDDGVLVVKPDSLTPLQAGRWLAIEGPPATAAIDPLTQATTGGFWNGWYASEFPTPTRLNGKINRLQDRVFVGEACVNSGDFPSTTKDWLEAFEAARSHPYGFRTSWSQFASVATNGGIAVMGAARTSDANLPTLQLAMGGAFFGINDNTVQQQLVTALYVNAWRLPGTGLIPYTGTTGCEIDITNEDAGSIIQLTPGEVNVPGFTTALQVNSGGVSPYSKTASAAITIGTTNRDFLSGIVMSKAAIAGLTYDGNGQPIAGAGSAMRLSAFHQIEWFTYPWSTPCFTITSQQLGQANRQSVIVRDTGIDLGGIGPGQGMALRLLYPQAVTGAYLSIAPSYVSGVTAQPLTLSAAGIPNADMLIQAAGTGQLGFRSGGGININGIADAAVSTPVSGVLTLWATTDGNIKIKRSDGTVKTVQVA